MGQQEGFRTPESARDDARGALPTPMFDERSAQKAAPVVPLERVARRRRFATRAAGGWRETLRSPQFRRSWPLALLLVATLAAGVAALNIYDHEDAARRVAPASAATGDDTGAAADAQKPAASAGREEIDNPRAARRAGEDSAGPDEKSAVNPEALTAAALGGFFGGDDERRDEAAAGRDERGGERDKGRGQKRPKRRHGGRRTSGGAILFDVIR